jgi:hypothetical protein
MGIFEQLNFTPPENFFSLSPLEKIRLENFLLLQQEFLEVERGGKVVIEERKNSEKSGRLREVTFFNLPTPFLKVKLEQEGEGKGILYSHLVAGGAKPEAVLVIEEGEKLIWVLVELKSGKVKGITGKFRNGFLSSFHLLNCFFDLSKYRRIKLIGIVCHQVGECKEGKEITQYHRLKREKLTFFSKTALPMEIHYFKIAGVKGKIDFREIKESPSLSTGK